MYKSPRQHATRPQQVGIAHSILHFRARERGLRRLEPREAVNATCYLKVQQNRVKRLSMRKATQSWKTAAHKS